MKRLITMPLAAALALAIAGSAGAMYRATDGTYAPPGVDATSAIVELTLDPLTTAPSTRPAPGKKVDFDSMTVKSYRAKLNAQKNDFKQWLQQNAPAAKVVGGWDISLNAVAVRLNGVPLGAIAAAPMVKAASYELNYAPEAIDPDLSLIDAFAAWGGSDATAALNAGKGVKVGIIDTGIDITSPCFGDAGFPKTPQLGDTRFTNDKVIVARVFNNKTPSQHYTAEAIQEHGTHVAGTVACDYGLANATTSVGGVPVPYGVLGVAPGAQLGSYNVFPGDVTNARSEDILDALDAAYADGMDVVNLSLGGNANGVQDLLTHAIDDLDEGGMVAAVAAGNSGPGHDTVESPGSAASALTAGASSVGHFIGTPVTVDGTTYGAAVGDFATVSSDLTAPLGVVTGSVNGLGTACSALPAGSLTGKIALLSRGTCTFSTKIRNAQDAGATAALVANNVAGDPVAMASDGTASQPTIPAYMVALSTGVALVGSDGHSATIAATQSYLQTANSNIMAGFSSQGPTDVDFRVKPDVVAPGVNVLSSIPSSFCGGSPCWAFFQGTSMATPHLAGSAAVVIGQHPGWSADEVRSAIVNTATQDVLTAYTNGTTKVADPNVVGAGLDTLSNAVSARVAVDPVSVSFGSVPSGSGQTRTFDVALTDLSGSGGTYPLAIGGQNAAAGVTFSVGSPTVTLTAGGSATVTVTMDEAKGADLGDHWATLSIGSAVHAAVYVFVKP